MNKAEDAIMRLDRFVRDVCANAEVWTRAVASGQVRDIAEALWDAPEADIELSLEVLRGAADGKRLADTLARQIDVRARTKRAEQGAKEAAARFDRDKADKAKKDESKRRDPKVWAALAKKASDARIALPTPLNVRRILEMDPRVSGRLRRNILADDVELFDEAERMWRAVRDSDEIALMYWVDEVYGISVNVRVVHDALGYLADANEVHPVAEWLRSLTWDGVNRIDRLLSHYFGAVPRPDVPGFDGLAARVSRAVLISMVARAMKQPCKVDTVLVLQGEEGSYKSTALALLSPDPTWTCDTLLPRLADTVEVYTQIKGTWIYEIAEIERWLTGRPADVDAVTAFVTGGTAKYRAKYGRNAEREPRMCVFVGTTTKREFLNEDKNRRYWPFRVGETNREAIAADRSQLWAEAVAAYNAGEPWHLTRPDEVIMAAAMDCFKSQDPWVGLLDAAISKLDQVHPAKGPNGIISVAEAMTLIGIPASQQTPQNAARMAEALRRNGFVQYRPKPSDDGRERPRMWRRSA